MASRSLRRSTTTAQRLSKQSVDVATGIGHTMRRQPTWFRRFAEVPGPGYVGDLSLRAQLPDRDAVPEVHEFDFDGKQTASLSWPTRDGSTSASPSHQRRSDALPNETIPQVRYRVLAALEVPGEIADAKAAIRAYLAEANPTLLRELESFLSSVEELRIELARALRERGTIAERELQSPLESLGAELARHDQEDKELAAADPQKQVADLKLLEVELVARLAIEALVPDMENFVYSEKWCKKAKRVLCGELSTKPVSSKERELFKKVVEGAYLDRLKAECAALDCAVPAFATRGQKGETLRSLKVGDYKPHRILSEGEQKALALADFLTEVGLNPASAGIILDDPVTSMDHDRKKGIAARLAREAKHRQVVVFTHDLVFLDLLLRAAERETVDCATHWIQRNAGSEPGYVVHDDHPVSSKEYETTKPAEKALVVAKAASGSEQVVAVRDGMGKLRRTLEEIVLKHLFKGAVSRWEERVKIAQIKSVSWSDAVADEVYGTFEELSRFVEGHSHSEAYETPPEPADLQKMITKVQGIVGRARAKRPQE